MCPLIDRHSHADFRDPGRMWLAWCPERATRNHSCSGAVFNAAGAGGHTNLVPAGFGQAVSVSEATVPFSESDAQHWRWPETDVRFLCTSRLNAVTLTDVNQRWTVLLDGHPTFGIVRGDRFLVATNHGAIYAIDKSGQVLWTYKSVEAAESLQMLPSGDLVILEKGRQTLSCVREGKLRWRYESAGLIDEFEDHITGTRRLAVADKDLTLYLVGQDGATSTTLAIDRNGRLLWKLSWEGYVNSGGLSLDARGRLFFTFQLYEIEHRSRGGVICIS